MSDLSFLFLVSSVSLSSSLHFVDLYNSLSSLSTLSSKWRILYLLNELKNQNENQKQIIHIKPTITNQINQLTLSNKSKLQLQQNSTQNSSATINNKNFQSNQQIIVKENQQEKIKGTELMIKDNGKWF